MSKMTSISEMRLFFFFLKTFGLRFFFFNSGT